MKEYETFKDVRNELEKQGKSFDSESLKRLRFEDIILAGIGNAGKTICPFELCTNEQQRRLNELSKLTIEEIKNDIGKWQKVEDINMVYNLMSEKAENKEFSQSNVPKWRLLIYYMKRLRGNWNGGRKSHYLQMIYELLPLVEKEGIVPIGWCKAVKNNADTFDGQYNDGRIMRDGQIYVDPEINKQFGIEGSNGSGNISLLIGGKQIKQENGYYGSYSELFEELLTPEQMVQYQTIIEDMEDE